MMEWHDEFREFEPSEPGALHGYGARCLVSTCLMDIKRSLPVMGRQELAEHAAWHSKRGELPDTCSRCGGRTVPGQNYVDSDKYCKV